MKPKDVKKDDDVLELERDNFDADNSWIMVEGDKVIITNQEPGSIATGQVELTHNEMKQIVDFYENG